MEIHVPEFSMVLMVGPTSSGKSTFARKHFLNTEIVASDDCRAVVSDDPNNQSATTDAFDLLHFITRTRLRNRRLTVVDATNLQSKHRNTLRDIAKENDCPTVAIIMATDLKTCIARGKARQDRHAEERLVRNQHKLLRQSTRQLPKERVRRVHVLETPEDADQATVLRTKPRLDQQEDHGPFDIIGDIHGCHEELMNLLQKLGYQDVDGIPTHPGERKAVFVGDLVDRGPAADSVLETVMSMTHAGTALCVSGNHENKLMRALKGNKVQITHGLAETLAQLDERPPEFKDKVKEFILGLNEHYLLDQGNLAVAHAGILERYQGRISGRIRNFCLYGQTTGENDEWGMPVREDWAADYRGSTMVVYGHTPVTEPRWLNNTINVDTGCVFGGNLTALRYPERELVSVPALKTYYEPIRPPAPAQEEHKENTPQDHRALQISDVTGRQEIYTSTQGKITIREQQAAAALETMTRRAVDPRWLVYLPPTISPSEASDLPHLLEHPAQAFEQYLEDGLDNVICEEKHMGSRAIMVLGKDQETITERFGIKEPNAGICYTRTGRRFFNDAQTEKAFLDRARAAVEKSGLWDELNTPWLVMDCEIMPWSMKAQGLLQNIYAPTAGAAINTLDTAHRLLIKAELRGVEAHEQIASTARRLTAAIYYQEAYRLYCWETDELNRVQVAPFHIMAGEGQLFTDRPHTWHMETAAKLHRADPEMFKETHYTIVNLNDKDSQRTATIWWEDNTRAGAEGMVVKPLDFIPRGKHGHVQPAIKVRGPQYLRIIYGPEYNLVGNIERLRRRNLRTKRNMALREFALGIEGLQRFIEHEPLHRVHQCAFAVMALESEPGDPRL